MVLGFYSALVQFLLLSEFIRQWANSDWLVGVVLFSWIFLSGAGSYIAISLGKHKSKLIFYGFLLLSMAPAISFFALKSIPFLPHGNIIGLTILILSPVCLLNGIMFSLLSQLAGTPSSISENYAFESAGTILAGISILTSANFHFNTLIFLAALGVILVLASFLIFREMRLKRLIFPLSVTVIIISVVFLFSPASVNESSMGAGVTEKITQPSINSPLILKSSVSFSNLNLQGIKTDLWIPAMVVLLAMFLFVRRLKPTGRTIFVAGFSCMATEILIMIPLKSYFESSQIAIGAILSVFMLGMVTGYSLKLPLTWNLENVFRKILRTLTGLGLMILAAFFIISGENSLGHGMAFWFIACGFMFSMFTGLLFSTGVKLQSGQMGKLVSATYGADMMGASLGALMVSSVLMPVIGERVILTMVVIILFLTGIFYRMAK